jgi:hypothetical protein
MKICPRCQKTYADDSLNFCLEDGATLMTASAPPLDATILMNEPRTAPSQPMPSQAGSQVSWQQPQPGWQQPQPVSVPRPPKKSSKTWLWVVGILGVVVLLCGGGFVGFIFWAASQADKTGTSMFNINVNRPTRSTPSSDQTSTNTTSMTTPSSSSTSTSDRSDVTRVDLDMFTKSFSIYSTTELNGDEFTVGSTMKDYFFAMVAPVKDADGDPVDDFKTGNADSRVTLRSIDNGDSKFGYGIVFHSDPKPLQQDYAFLIDMKKKKYRVVRHQAEKELGVVKWTASPAINGGTEENTLEVRDQTDKIDLYINGTMVTSIPNTYGFPGGVVGLYSGGGAKIAFKNLEIRR